MNVYYNDVKHLPIIEYLAYRGLKPRSKVTNEVYYLCPYRLESRPSLAVSTNKNVWFDFGDNVGGTIIDLALRLFNGDRYKANEDLARFAAHFGGSGIVHLDYQGSEKEDLKCRNGIRIINVRDISHQALTQLITWRGINIEVAKRYCKEVWFENRDGRRCFAIGLPNMAMGWELRGLKSFKCSTQPKAISLVRIGESKNRVSVFEGLFDMLSYSDYCILNNNAEPPSDLLCLNSLSLVNSSYSILEGYKEIDLYLDTDNPGRKTTLELLCRFNKANDRSKLYSTLTNCKDFNEWYIKYQQNKR